MSPCTTPRGTQCWQSTAGNPMVRLTEERTEARRPASQGCPAFQRIRVTTDRVRVLPAVGGPVRIRSDRSWMEAPVARAWSVAMARVEPARADRLARFRENRVAWARLSARPGPRFAPNRTINRTGQVAARAWSVKRACARPASRETPVRLAIPVTRALSLAPAASLSAWTRGRTLLSEPFVEKTLSAMQPPCVFHVSPDRVAWSPEIPAVPA